MIRNGIVLLGVSVYWQEGFLGIVLIVAVIIDNFMHRKKKLSETVILEEKGENQYAK